MRTQTFQNRVARAVKKLREIAPRDTGNLADNAITLEWRDENTAVIYVDEKIAPYMPYTNEPWISTFWRGKKNPNQYWFDRAAKMVIETVVPRIDPSDIRRASYEDVNTEEMLENYQNKRGDLVLSDMLINSEYLEGTGAFGWSFGGMRTQS